MGEAIELIGLSAGYGETVVVNDVSFLVPGGSAIAVLGRNGVGKSTLLATIMGHTTLHAGEIVLGGRDISDLPIYERVHAGLGYVPQEREIFPSLTVEENLSVAARPGRWTAEAVFELFPSLFARRTNYGGQLSGGEQQMLSVGRALMGNPRVLLLDEPLEGLAPVVVDQLMSVFFRLCSEHDLTVLFVEQHARLALEFAPVAVVLDRGAVVYAGPSAALQNDVLKLDELIGVRR